MLFVEPRPTRPLAIRMTPLIDVVFILLVFFMLTTRLLPVNLLEVPTAAPNQSAGRQEDPVPEIQILPGERLKWNQREYSLANLTQKLRDEGIGRVHLTSAPEATVHDFTLTLSTLGAKGIEPRWLRNQTSESTR